MEQQYFKNIFKSYSPILYFYVNKQVKDRQVAEEIVHETFMRFWGSNYRIENDKGIFKFLHMHARHATDRYLDESKKRIEHLEMYADTIFTPNEEEYPPAHHIMKLYDRINNLPHRLKKVIQLSMQGLKPYEVATKLRVPASTVTILKSHAYEFLRKDLAQASTKDGGIIIEQISIKEDEINAELISYFAKHPHKMHDLLNPYKFEKLVAELLRAMGYDVHHTSPGRDGGRDIIAVIKIPPNREMVTIVECKRNRADKKVGVKIVRDFLYIIRDQDKANAGWLVTTSSFTRGVIETQKKHKWQLSLTDNNELAEWCSKYGQWKRSGTGGIWLPNNPVG